jgi:hypothetical protein
MLSLSLGAVWPRGIRQDVIGQTFQSCLISAWLKRRSRKKGSEPFITGPGKRAKKGSEPFIEKWVRALYPGGKKGSDPFLILSDRNPTTGGKKGSDPFLFGPLLLRVKP